MIIYDRVQTCLKGRTVLVFHHLLACKLHASDLLIWSPISASKASYHCQHLVLSLVMTLTLLVLNNDSRAKNTLLKTRQVPWMEVFCFHLETDDIQWCLWCLIVMKSINFFLQMQQQQRQLCQRLICFKNVGHSASSWSHQRKWFFFVIKKWLF